MALNRRMLGGGALGLAILLAWLAWPEPEPERPLTRSERARQSRTVERTLKSVRRPPPVAPQLPDRPVIEEPDAPLALVAPVDTALAEGTLVVDVVDDAGRPIDNARVFVSNCQSKPLEPGMWSASGDCSVTAIRRDGMLMARDQTTVVVDAGEEVYLQLTLPSERTGGLGVQIAMHDGAIRVLGVTAGSPAEAQGLERGDRITEVDGVSVAELGLQGFIQAMTGPEGTDVQFVLSYDDVDGPVEEVVEITRAFLPKG